VAFELNKESMQNFAPGARVEIRDELWIVRRVERSSDGGFALLCDGISELVRDRSAWFLTKLEGDVQLLDPALTELVPDKSPRYRDTLLYLGTLLRRNIPNDDKVHLASRAVMRLKHYQLVPVTQGLRQPRTRILIADAVGLGKTLEAGMLTTELIQRGRGKRILVVSQKSMLTQFQKEFWTRFTIPLVRLDSVGLARVRNRIPANHNPFNFYDRTIISMDTLKSNLEYRNYLSNAWWDIIIIDECHNVALRAADETMSRRARLARLLATRSDTLIMLSATPHDGSARSFASLMNLLDPTAIGDPDNFDQDDYRDKGLVVRRFRKDIQQEAGADFPERALFEHRVQASPAEEDAYRALLEIPFTQRGEHRVGRPQELQRIATQKWLFSSPASAILSAEKRIEQLSKRESPTPAEQAEITAQQRYLSAVNNIKPLQFTKYQQLLQLLSRGQHAWHGNQAEDRLVIFSERIETLRWLGKQLPKDLRIKAKQIEILHGGMSDTDQQEIVDRFGRLDDPIRLLLCSDVASEGLNLHYFCHRLIHFDLPWSLMTFQQRNGRIDRFGQTQQPLIHWFATETAVEQIKGDLRILEILIRKENQAYRNLGDPTVFLKAHDKQKEEERVQELMSSEESAEQIEKELDQNAEQAQQEGGEEWWMDLFQGATVPVEEQQPEEVIRQHSVWFFDNDWSFAKAALEALNDPDPIVQWSFDEASQSITITAPKDLQTRLRQIPGEARSPEDRYTLTTQLSRMEQALDQARQARSGSETWPTLSYLWPQHPVMEWLLDRLESHFGRHAAPVVRSNRLQPGEIAFVLMAIIPNRKGQPLLVEWQVARHLPGQDFVLEPFKNLTDRLGFKAQAVPNPGEEHIPRALQQALPAAIEVMNQFMIERQKAFSAELQAQLDNTLASLKELQDKQLAQLERQLEQSREVETSKTRKRQYRAQEIDRVFDDYRSWVENTMQTEPVPFIQVLAAFCHPDLKDGP
jgi:superfamily II DNA or RNA helicase